MTLAQRFNLVMALETIETEKLELAAERANETDIKDISDSIDYSNDELGKGLEAVANLIQLSNKIDTNVSKGIAIENYSDIANLSYNSIRKSMGLEADDDSNPSKIKDFAKKTGEVLKKLWEKLMSFLKTLWDKTQEYFDWAKIRLEKIIESLKDKVFDSKTISLDEPRFYKEIKEITPDVVFNNKFYNGYKNNLENFIHYVDILDSSVKLEELNKSTQAFVKAFTGIEHSRNDVMTVTQITPNGFIEFDFEEGTLAFNNGGPTIIHVDEQNVKLLKDKDVLEYANEFLGVQMTFIENVKEIQNKLKKFTVKLEKKVFQFELDLTEGNTTGDDQIKLIRKICTNLSIINRGIVKFQKDFIDGPSWYLDLHTKPN